jgi:DNA polymerase III subunit delta
LLLEPAFLSSKEDQNEAFRRAREMWGQGRQREAARRLLALAAKAGWSAQELAADDRPGAEEWRRELSVEDAWDADFAAAAARFAVEREMKAGKDDASALDALLAGTGKRVDAAAERRLGELVGTDARTLAAELGKLVAHAGDRQVVTAADVDGLVVRVAEDPFYALGNAVEARDLARALAVLDRSLADGASPFLLLATLASAVRRLLVERERGRKAVGARVLRSYRDWEASVLPLVAEEELGGRKPFGLWKKYEAAQRYGRGELLDALAGLAEADLGMKSGGDARSLLERALWTLIAAPALRSTT